MLEVVTKIQFSRIVVVFSHFEYLWKYSKSKFLFPLLFFFPNRKYFNITFYYSFMLWLQNIYSTCSLAFVFLSLPLSLQCQYYRSNPLKNYSILSLCAFSILIFFLFYLWHWQTIFHITLVIFMFKLPQPMNDWKITVEWPREKQIEKKNAN